MSEFVLRRAPLILDEIAAAPFTRRAGGDQGQGPGPARQLDPGDAGARGPRSAGAAPRRGRIERRQGSGSPRHSPRLRSGSAGRRSPSGSRPSAPMSRCRCRLPAKGRIHPISQTIDEIVAIFGEMGFVVAEGPHIEEDFYNFTALNIPPEHPARQEHDTFYLPERADGTRLVLRTHTSPVQIRTMLAQQPPIRIIVPGRTFRCRP